MIAPRRAVAKRRLRDGGLTAVYGRLDRAASASKTQSVWRGRDDGMAAEQFVYLHGQPGSPDELDLVLAGGWRGAANLFAPDRARDWPDLASGPYLDHLAETIARRFPDGPIRLVGFSLGGFVAMEVALRLTQVERGGDLSLDLVSTAVPLGLGDFLPDMAGGAVFSLARDWPPLFGLLTRFQGGVAHVAPKALFAQLFATAAGADADLARAPDFQARLQAILAHSFASGARGYRRDIRAYVAQAPAPLSRLTAPITLWHGEADTWAPPAMAHALAAARPKSRRVRAFPGLSHYSTLQAAGREIFRGLA